MLASISFSSWLSKYVIFNEMAISDAEILKFISSEDKKALNEILDRQYNEFSPKGLNQLTDEIGITNDRTTTYVLGQNILASIADSRMNSAFKSIESHKESIKEISFSFGIPPEYVAAIILKEQYTQSIPDWLAIVLRKLDLTRGSTGLGAISAPTARVAWEYVDRHIYEVLPQKDADLLKKLANDSNFNIETICAVLCYEANDLKIGDKGNIEQLSKDDWHKIYNKYNGDIEYANNTIEYTPYMGGLLN